MKVPDKIAATIITPIIPNVFFITCVPLSWDLFSYSNLLKMCIQPDRDQMESILDLSGDKLTNPPREFSRSLRGFT
jgi:hypothetical protein